SGRYLSARSPTGSAIGRGTGFGRLVQSEGPAAEHAPWSGPLADRYFSGSSRYPCRASIRPAGGTSALGEALAVGPSAHSSKAKMRFQSSFMLMTIQPLLLASSARAGVEGSDPGVGQSPRRAVGVLTLGIVVQHQHGEPFAVPGLGVLQHLPVAGRVAERRVGPAADDQVDALWLAGVVIVQEQLRLLGEKRPAV